MTTIILSEATKRQNGRFQVFGNYDGTDDRYTFGVQSFATKPEAEAAARRMMAQFQADHFQRVAN